MFNNSQLLSAFKWALTSPEALLLCKTAMCSLSSTRQLRNDLPQVALACHQQTLCWLSAIILNRGKSRLDSQCQMLLVASMEITCACLGGADDRQWSQLSSFCLKFSATADQSGMHQAKKPTSAPMQQKALAGRMPGLRLSD